MACDYCTDPNGERCYPILGLAPHTHEFKKGKIVFGGTEILSKDKWPDNFKPLSDDEDETMGMYSCPKCGE